MPYRDRRRQRYAEDPGYREKILASNRASQERNKEHRNHRHRLRIAADPDYRKKRKAWLRANALKSTYGITLEQYDAMVKEQGGVCAICGERPEEHLCVDHSHATGKIRGLLCRRCNSGLGCYNDDLRLTMGASAYLRRAQLLAAAGEDGFPLSELLR
jgi:hypothetical protein